MKTSLTTYSFKASNGVKIKREIVERTPGMYLITSTTNFVKQQSVQPGGIVQMMMENDLKSLEAIIPQGKEIDVPDANPDCSYYSTGIETNRENEIIFIVINKKTGQATTTTFIKKPVTNTGLEDNE